MTDTTRTIHIEKNVDKDNQIEIFLSFDPANISHSKVNETLDEVEDFVYRVYFDRGEIEE